MTTVKNKMANRPAPVEPNALPLQRRPWHCVAGGLMALLMAQGADGRAAEEPERNWLQEQVDKFRAYPHLHRAYGHMKQNRLAEMELDTLPSDTARAKPTMAPSSSR